EPRREALVERRRRERHQLAPGVGDRDVHAAAIADAPRARDQRTRLEPIEDPGDGGLAQRDRAGDARGRRVAVTEDLAQTDELRPRQLVLLREALAVEVDRARHAAHRPEDRLFVTARHRRSLATLA